MLGCDADSDPMGTAETGSVAETENPGATTTTGTPDPATEPTVDPSATSGVDTTDSDTDIETTGMSFITEPDGGGIAVECDVWTDDCPDGQKCMPWANDGGSSWNATRCSPIDASPGQPGDACTVEGSGVSGVDTCDSRSMCYYVDPDTSEGICIGFCDGSPQAPTCDANFICTIVNDGVLTLCRPECDPLLQNCDGTAACLPANGSDGFTCIIDASGEGGGFGDPCEFINACDPGLFCANAEVVPDCGGTGCCSSFCDMSEPDCPDASQECVAWFEEGATPPGLEDVGACAIPI